MDVCAMNCHHRFYTLDDFFASAHNNGFHFVELWTGPMHFYMDANGYDSITRLIQLENRYDMKIIGICPEQTNPKPHNMAASSPQAKQRVLAYFKNAIDVAAALQANQVVVTSGWAYYHENLLEAKLRSANMLKELCTYASNKHVRLAIEALQPKESHLVNTIQDLKAFLTMVDHKNLFICLDFGAMANAQETIKDYFDAFGTQIIHSHFVDGNPTGHMPWGKGTRDMKEDLKNLKDSGYDRYLSFEIVHASTYEKPFEADASSKQLFETYRKELDL